MRDFDVAVVGSGFGGSLMAMIAARLGLRTILIERGRHPRFVIGESASPLAGVILEQLADRYGLPRIWPLASYGAWRRAYPEVVCGLKRGFTYFKHQEGKRYACRSDRSNQLLVAASPHDEVSDTHWLRSDVDHFLVLEAISAGVEYLDEAALETLEWRPDGGAALAGRRGSQPLRIDAAFVIDATGPHGFLSRVLGIAPKPFDGYPSTQALYSHFIGVEPCADMPDFSTAEVPPYPVDAAALHHVFDEGWMWVLRFDNGVTSAGVAITDALAADLRLADGEPAWRRLLARYPSIEAQFAGARAIREFTWMPRVAYRASTAAGDGWAMLPSSAAFVDPLFSTGIPLTLLGIERLAARLTGHDAARAYSDVTLEEAEHTAGFIAGCYAAFPRFTDFVSYSMFYFAAASFSEMARRLGQTTGGFLGARDATFAGAMRRLSPAKGGSAELDREVARAIDARNVAGLCDVGKRNWYAVDPNDTVAAAWKLNASPTEIKALLREPSRPCGAGSA